MNESKEGQSNQQTANALSSLLAGKKCLILGIVNNRSIAWGIAKKLKACGAELIFGYQNESLLKRVKPLADSIEVTELYECDVSKDENIKELFANIKTKHNHLDYIIHSIAFSDRNELEGKFIDTSLDNFLNTMHISVYSLTAVIKAGLELLKASENPAIITLTYYGSVKVIPHYNVMGVAKAALEASVRYLAADLGAENIRVNAISAGPIRTLAASGIGDFKSMLKWGEINSPLRKGVTPDNIGDAAIYLLSDLAKGVTGEIHYVDSGYNVMGMADIEMATQNIELLNNFVKN